MHFIKEHILQSLKGVSHSLKLSVCEMHRSVCTSPIYILYLLFSPLFIVKGVLEHIPACIGLKLGKHLGDRLPSVHQRVLSCGRNMRTGHREVKKLNTITTLNWEFTKTRCKKEVLCKGAVSFPSNNSAVTHFLLFLNTTHTHMQLTHRIPLDMKCN